MNMNMIPFLAIWACIAAAAIGLALYRRLLTRNEDDYVHVAEGEASRIPQQLALAQKLDVIDRWEKILISAAVIIGILIGAAYLYQLWNQSSQLS